MCLLAANILITNEYITYKLYVTKRTTKGYIADNNVFERFFILVYAAPHNSEFSKLRGAHSFTTLVKANDHNRPFNKNKSNVNT